MNVSPLRLAAAVSIACAFVAGCRTTDRGDLLSRPYDLVIHGGTIIDGTGAPSFTTDIGIRGDEIIAMGQLDPDSARDSIDATGLVVAPGFIDLLGWSHNAVFRDPRLEGKIRQGVTTEATGEGTSPAPISGSEIERRSSEGERPAATMAEFMDRLDQNGSAINFALFVGATNPRIMVLGYEDREPTEAEMQEMERIIDQAMREGAIGISTSLIYVPATFASTDELVRLARVAQRHGGVYFTHIRNESDQMMAAIDEAIHIGRETGIPVNIWHLKRAGRNNWGTMGEAIARIQAARDEGLDVAANIYPYEASSTGLSAVLPTWALEGGYAAMKERLTDPDLRPRIIREIQDSAFYGRLGGFSGVLVTQIPHPELAQYERMRLSEIAEAMGVEPMDALLRLYEETPYSPSAIYFQMSMEDVHTAARVPWVSVGADSGAFVGDPSSGGVHPRAYGTFPRIVGPFVRDEELFTLEEAIRKITSQAAARLHLWDRGILRPGMKADITAFDPDTIRDVSTYEDPHHQSIGVEHVIVNGVPVLRSGAMTGELPGRTLRKTAAW